VIVTNYCDISKFSNLLALCSPYEINQLDFNEMWSEDTLEAYFSVPEDYHMGKEKRKLFVFTNASLDFLKIITSHTEIKYIVILNSDKSISESDIVKNAKNTILYSTKTGIFNPEFESDTWENDLIGSIEKQTNFATISKNIDDFYLMAKSIYLSFASGKNTEIRNKIDKFTPTMRKVLIPKLEQFIAAYYTVDIIIAGNGARIRTPQEIEHEESEPSPATILGESQEKKSPIHEGIPQLKSEVREGKELDLEAKEDQMPAAKKKSTKKPTVKSDSAKSDTKPIQKLKVAPDTVDYSMASEYSDSLDPLLEEQHQDLMASIQEVAEKSAGKKSDTVQIKTENQPSHKKELPNQMEKIVNTRNNEKIIVKQDAKIEKPNPIPNPLMPKLNPPPLVQKPKEPAQVQSNIQPNVQKPNIQSNMQINAQPNFHPNIQPNTQISVQKPSVQTNVQNNVQNNVQTNVQNNVQNNVQTNVQNNVQTNIQTNIQAIAPPPILSGLHPPAGVEAKANIAPVPREPLRDQRYAQLKGEVDRMAGIDRNMYRVFCQVLSEYKSLIQSNKYCEEIVNPEQIYIELRSGVWANKVPAEFSNKWFYMHVLNQLKSKPHNIDTEFGNAQQTMEGLLASFPFIEQPDYAMVFGKIKARLSQSSVQIQANTQLQANKEPQSQSNSSVQPQKIEEKSAPIKKPQSQKVPIGNSSPHQEVIDSIRIAKMQIKAGEIEDFEGFGRAMKRIIEFITDK
jgi:hypothetical protein